MGNRGDAPEISVPSSTLGEMLLLEAESRILWRL